MKKITFAVALIISLIACEKGSFETKPELEVTALSTDVVPRGGVLNVTLEFRDKEGDVDSALFITRQRLNVKGDTITRPDTFIIPSFPDKNKGEIQVTLSQAGFLSRGGEMEEIRIPGSGSDSEPDTLKLYFVLADKKGNRSDTATADVIVIR